MSTSNPELAAALHNALKRSRVTVTAVAAELGVSKGTVSRWRYGGLAVNDERAKQLEDALGLDAGDLTGLVPTPHEPACRAQLLVDDLAITIRSDGLTGHSIAIAATGHARGPAQAAHDLSIEIFGINFDHAEVAVEDGVAWDQTSNAGLNIIEGNVRFAEPVGCTRRSVKFTLQIHNVQLDRDVVYVIARDRLWSLEVGARVSSDAPRVANRVTAELPGVASAHDLKRETLIVDALGEVRSKWNCDELQAGYAYGIEIAHA